MLNNKIKSKILKFLGVVFLLLISILVIKIDDYEDYNLTVIVKADNFQFYENKDLFKGDKLIGEFEATNNNLGIVSVKFNTHNKVNDDYLQFKIKEVGSSGWYYSNKYKVDQFQNNKYFPFGFPQINNSKGKEYQIEIESLAGVEGNSIKIKDNASFLSKYSFPKAYLMENKIKIPVFIFNKIKSFFNNIDDNYYLLLLVVFCIYLIFLKFRVINKIFVFLKIIKFFLIRNIFNNKILNNKKIEIFITLILYVLLVVFLGKILFYKNMQSQYGDATFAAQIMQNIGKNFKFESSFARSIIYSFSDVWYKTADYVCSSPLITPEKFPPWGHFYFIAFPLGFLLSFFNVYWFMAFCQSIIYSSVLLFVYVIARKYKVNIINSILLVLIAAQHPLWINGMYGQFYFNRIFLLFCSIVIFLLFNKKINYFLIALFSLLAISTNEIYGIVLFMVFIAYLFLFKYDKKILFFSICSLFISLILIYIIQQSAESNLTQNGVVNSIFSGNLINMVVNLYKNITSGPSGIFLLVNFIFSGLFILIRPKLVIVWLFFLLPNLIIYIGKLSWSTHYHISYFVPILWFLVYSISLIKFKNKFFITLILLVYLIIISRFNLDIYKFDKPNFIVNKIYSDYKNISLDKKNILDKFNRLQSAVDKNDKISLPEVLSYPFLNHEIYYYPVEIDKVDKVVLFFNKNKTGDSRFFSINYGHQDDNLDNCILARMRKNNFDLDNVKVFDELVVIGKK